MCMKVYILCSSHFNGTETEQRIEGVISDKAKAEKWAEARGNWYHEYEVDACLPEIAWALK